ncbi:MAG: hypothetical protein D8M59_13175 [Planctomycetes bacterium]|nr:hypothetical protein [Planctomycetota bacterium]NOG54954.1 hypothetical protein [Planctomycetota bacterium]
MTTALSVTGSTFLLACAIVSGSLPTPMVTAAAAMTPGPHLQEQQQQPKAPPAPPPVNWEKKGLSATPIILESIGFSIHLPLDCKVSKHVQGARRLFITSNDGRWMAAVDVDRSANPATTVDDVVKSTQESIQKASREGGGVTSDQAMPFARSAVVVNGRPARQLQVQIKRPNGIMETRLFTIVSPMPSMFVVYTIWCGSDAAEEVSKLYQASVDSITFEDPGHVLLDRENATAAVQKCLEPLNQATYEKLLCPERWYRIYKYDDRRKEQEIGYYRVTEELAQRGRLSPSRAQDRYTRAEREQGILVTLVARYVLPDGTISEVDSRSWSSLDRESEIWSIRSSSYQFVATGRYLPASISALTGARAGDMITLTLELPNQPVNERQYRKPQTAYVTQAERFLLYRILKPWDQDAYGSYYLDPSTMKLAFRVDRFEQPVATTGDVTCEQHLRQDAPPSTVTLDQDGLIKRIVASTGEVTVPSTLDAIHRLWTKAGLPTSSMSKLISNSGGAGRDSGRGR